MRLSIPRGLLKRFHAVLRKARLHTGDLPLQVVTSDGQLFLSVVSHDVAVQVALSHAGPDYRFTLPMMFLTDAAGSQDAVQLDLQDDKVLASWTDCGIPQLAVHARGATCREFPSWPSDHADNPAELWEALRAAVAVTDPASSRYALGCVQLRADGQVVATDGRQLLVQAGYSFPWPADLLVPGLPLLGCRELAAARSVEVARSEQWVLFRQGDWTVALAPNTEGRFPALQGLLPARERFVTRLELDERDARFLLDALGALPDDPDHGQRLTVDLHGHVILRARAAADLPATELVLTNSRYLGEPVCLCTDRRYLQRAVTLGLRELFIYGADRPLLAADDRRQFLWALLELKLAVPASDQAIRVVSPSLAASPSTRPRRRRTPAAA